MKHDGAGVTRRRFIQAAGVGVAALVSSGGAVDAMPTPGRAFEHGAPLGELGYDQVEFGVGPQREQLEQIHDVLMSLSEDSLLRPFRHWAGLPTPGFELGGWYSSNDPNAGHAFGQWLSALSRYYAITRDEKTREKVFRLMQGYADTIEPAGRMYASHSHPAYLYDKLVCGLMDAHQFAGHEEGLEILARATSAALPHLPDQACVPAAAHSPNCTQESYTIAENQFIAWQRGGDARHLEVGRRYLHEAFFDSLARGENVLAGRHAYSHVNALCSAAKAYLVFGEKKCLDAAVNGFAFVQEQSFATGGWGSGAPEALFPKPAIRIAALGIDDPAIRTPGESVLHERRHFETGCGSYAHFKLTRYLLRITKDSRYGDSMERVMYNAALGAKPLRKLGKAFYFSSYHAAARKEYFDGLDGLMEDEWPCCSGTLPQVAADYAISTYFLDRAGLYVNLFIPSTVRWEQGRARVSLTQSGSYPLDDLTVFDIAVSRPTRFAIRVRIPAWAGEPVIRINGKVFSRRVSPGAFLSVQREWRSGDRIELVLPRSLQLHPVDDEHPDLVALVSGPLVLFAVADEPPAVTRAQLLAARQRRVASAEWLTQTARGVLSLVPWWAIHDESYFTYFSA